MMGSKTLSVYKDVTQHNQYMALAWHVRNIAQLEANKDNSYWEVHMKKYDIWRKVTLF